MRSRVDAHHGRRSRHSTVRTEATWVARRVSTALAFGRSLRLGYFQRGRPGQRLSGFGNRSCTLFRTWATLYPIFLVGVCPIVSSQRVEADLHQVFQHFQAVLQVADTAALVVAPCYRNLIHTHSQPQGNVEDFGIESPPFNALPDKYGLGCLPAECLESALRIRQREIHDHPCEPVETPSEESPVNRLAKGLARPVQPSRSDGNVGAFADGVE